MAVFTSLAAAFTAFSSWTITLGSLGTFAIGNFLLRAAVQLGVSALAKAFAKKGAGSEPFAIQGNVRTGGSVARSFGFGPYLSAGSLVWHTEWGTDGGTPNAYYTQVIALSDLPVAGLHRWFIEGRAVTLEDAGDEKGLAAVEYREGGQDHAWIRFHDGTQTVVDTFLNGTVSNGAPRAYSQNRIGTGIAYAVVTFRVNQEIFTGFPRSKFVLNGVKLYDVSKDSTQGGTGAHRWDDPATWGGDGDALPAVQAYNLARGITFGGKWFYGLQGLTAARLPAAHWIAQVEKCRAAIDGEDGPEPIYRCAGEITVNSEIGSAFEAILTACAGRMSEVGGIFKIYVGAPDAPIASITDEDIVSLAAQTFTPFYGLSDTVNGVIASYPSPDEGYVMRSTPPLYNADFEVEDGGRRLMTDVQLSFVPFPAQAQRLLAGELAAARRARRHTFTLPARFRLIEPGDVVAWDSERNGYAAKQFRIDGVIDLPNCDLIVDLTEVDSADHGSWNHASDYVPVTPSPVLPVVPSVQGVTGFNPVAADIQDAAGTARRPGLLMQWNGAVEDIAGIQFEVRVKATAAVVSTAETRAFDAAQLPIEAGLVASTVYEARARYIPGAPRAVAWTSWVEVSTNDVRFGSDDFGPDAIEWSVLGQAVRDQIDSAGDANLSAQVAADAQAVAEAAALGASTSAAAALASEALASGAQGAASTSAAAALASQRAAETAEGSAAGSASAAASSASAASASETAAGSSASAAETSRISAAAGADAAGLSAAAVFPADFREDGRYFTRSNGVLDPVVMSASDVVDVPGTGPVAQSVGFNFILPRGYLPAIPGRVYEWRAVVRAVVDGTSPGVGEEAVLSASLLDGAGVIVGYSGSSPDGGSRTHEPLRVGDGWVELACQVVVPAQPDYSFIRPRLYACYVPGGPHGDTVWQVRSLTCRDVTELVGAAGSASAAASSASAASASETAAGSSASAAESARVAAETAEGNAAGSASAAASSASAASASETAAGFSASSASQSANTAGTAASGASASETAAASSATDAEGSASAAAQSATVASETLTQFRLEHTDFQRILDGVSAVDAVGDLETVIEGGSVLGQGGSVISGTGAGTIATGGATNGLSVEIPQAQALQFSGRRVRVDVLARQPSASPAAKFVAAYSTAENGNSGENIFDLSASWAWYSFYYTLPIAVAGGSDFVGLWGDQTQAGLNTQFARVVVRPAPLAEDIPEIGIVQAEAAAASQAITDLEGNASASYVLRARAGGGAGAVEVAAWDSVDGGPASRVTLTGDEIGFDGLSVFDGGLQSDDFITGVSGWRIQQGGNAEFNQLIVRESIVDQAVSNGGAYTAALSPWQMWDGNSLGDFALGVWSIGEAWVLSMQATYRRLGRWYGPQNPEGSSCDGFSVQVTPLMQWRTMVGGAWGAWETLETFPTATGDSWITHYASAIRMGDFEGVQLRMLVTTFDAALGPQPVALADTTDYQANFQDVGYYGRSLVR